MSVRANPTENAKLQELFLAVYFNDVQKVINFRDNYPEIYAKRNNFQVNSRFSSQYSFDLMILTFFNQTIWNTSGWSNEIIEFIENNRHKTKQMLDYWQEERGSQNIQRIFEYNQYWEFFYCEDPADKDIVSMEPIAYYLEKGFREIDLRLYNRAECFDFVETKKLLELGANPDIHIEEDEDSSILSRIETQSSFLYACQIIPEFKVFKEKGYNQIFNIDRMFGDLLGLAAHEEMYDLLNSYSKED